VRVDLLFSVIEPSRAAGARVSFEPGARTAWHSHPLGQTLIVTAGTGWVQQKGGPVEEICEGDVVRVPPGVKHWHGATATARMTHIAIQEQLNGQGGRLDGEGHRRAVPTALSRRPSGAKEIIVRGTVLYGPRDIRSEERPEPKITQPTDAIIRISATCICGSDLWPYRGIGSFDQPTPMGHEYCGIVEDVGSAVRSIKPGQFVVGSFATSDNTCDICQHGYQSSCHQREFMSSAQATMLRVPLADGTLVPTRALPSNELIPSLLATSDVFGTGWFAADAANVKPGSTVVVVGDGAVGLLGVLSAKQMGAERIIAMSRHEARQEARPRVWCD
jgi:quercetin dioxygenase-like cupin family protein